MKMSIPLPAGPLFKRQPPFSASSHSPTPPPTFIIEREISQGANPNNFITIHIYTHSHPTISFLISHKTKEIDRKRELVENKTMGAEIEEHSFGDLPFKNGVYSPLLHAITDLPLLRRWFALCFWGLLLRLKRHTEWSQAILPFFSFFKLNQISLYLSIFLSSCVCVCFLANSISC